MRSFCPRAGEKIRLIIIFAFLALHLSVPVAASPTETLKAYPKLDWGLEDVYVTGYPPNVLLLIDTGSPMIWTPQGKMPSTKVNLSATPLAGCTYGDGSLPTSKWKTRNLRYGRDLDSSNNDIHDDSCYYNNLIFRDRAYSRENPKPGYTVDDLIPNDSRLYKMKLVLWRLMESPDLIKDINMGMATFWQQHIPNGAWADWYKVKPYEGGPDWIINGNYSTGTLYRDSQTITWGVDVSSYYNGSQAANKARLRVPIESTSESDVVDRIKKLIDGEESAYNDEIRADGKAPLARAIYSDKVAQTGESNGDISGTVWHFFNNTDMGGICQTNWLVVLTAGDDNIGGESPVDSVKALYRNSKSLNGTTLEYPIRTLVIGFVDPEDDSPDMVKLRDTLNRMAFYGMDGGYEANGTPKAYVEPEEGESYALFANDVPGLLQGFSKVFATIQSGRFGSNAPVVVKSQGEEEEFFAFVPSYVRKGEGQWQGDLRKENTQTGITLWSAEEKLPSPDNRNVYTVNWNEDGVPDSGIGNLARFAPETYFWSRSAFSGEMGFDDSYKRELNDFIGWILGYRKYGYNDQSRREHVLADMEHSGLCLVGSPEGSYTDDGYLSFKKKWENRDKTIYIQSNGGMLHAFDPDTGVERWSFVPPNALSAYRLASLRFVVSRLGDSDNYRIDSYSSGNMSLPLYLLDGPIAVGDVRKPSGEYATVLVGFLGRGGAGMFAMDITDPLVPRFLWAIENVFDVNNNSEKKLYWIEKDGGDQVGCYLNVVGKNESPLFNLLGFTITGAPSLGHVKTDGGERAVLVLSGGVGTKKDGKIGKAIYVVDALTGEIVHSFLRSSDQNGLDSDLGAVLSPAVAYSTGMRDRIIEGFFASDSEGSILNGKTKGLWALDKIWSLSCPYSREGIQFSSLVNPLPLGVGLIKNDVWILGGTSSLSLLGKGDFKNDINVIFSLNSDSIKKSSGFRDFNNDGVGIVRQDDNNRSHGELGWFMPLSKVTADRGTEYCTTSPLLSHGALFIATYQRAIQEDKCSTDGFAHLYVMDIRTGKGLLNRDGKKRLTFAGLKIAGISIAGDSILLSIKKMKPFKKPDDAGDIQIAEKGDLIKIDLNDLNLPDLPGSQTPKSIYWRELFFQ